jgi:hypothetical protein
MGLAAGFEIRCGGLEALHPFPPRLEAEMRVRGHVTVLVVERDVVRATVPSLLGDVARLVE